MKAKQTKICVNCRCAFFPEINLSNQMYCSKTECQKTRKARWMRRQRRYDKDYKENKKISQGKWQTKNQDYWKKYRDHIRHVKYAEIAKEANGKRIDCEWQNNKRRGEQKIQKTKKVQEAGARSLNVLIEKKDVMRLIEQSKSPNKSPINCKLNVFSQDV